MPVTVGHVLTATTPDDPAWEIRPSHWNSSHAVSLNAVGSEISGAFSNGGNVSFGLSANGFVTASANVTAAPSPVNVTGANGSSVNAQTIQFDNANGISLGVSTAANGATVTGSYTVPSNFVQSVNGSSGAISLNVGSSLSASTNGSSITFGLASNITTALQPAGAYLTTAALSNHSHGNPTLNLTNLSGTTASNSAGFTLSLSAAAQGLTSQSNQNVTAANGGFAFQTLSFSNAQGVSFGTSAGSAIVASVETSYAASNHSHGNPTLALTNLTGTTASASNGFTLSLSAAAGGAFSAGVSGGNTAGDTGATGTRVVFAGGNNVTLSQATDANGATITFSGANAGGAQTGISGIVVSNTTYTSGTVSFSNANGISFGSSAGQAITASYTVPTVTNSSWTVSDNATSATVGRLAFTQANGITMSLSTSNNGNHTVFASHNGLTSQSNQNVTAANGGFAFQTLSFSNLNGISFGTSAGSAITASHNAITTGRASTDAIGLNTAQSNVTWTVNSAGLSLDARGYAGTATTFNGANISGSITQNSVGINLSLSVAAPGAAAENNAINLLGANTAGNTTATGSTIGWSGLNVTLSGANNSQVVISAPATSSLVGVSGIIISTAGSTISIGQGMVSYFDNYLGIWPNSTTMTFAQSTSHVLPFILPEQASFGFLRMPMTASLIGASTTAATTGNSQFSYGLSKSHNFVLYSRGVGASSMSLMSVTSTQLTERQSINVSANANSTQFSYTNRVTYQMSTGPVGYTFDYSSSAASLNFHTSNMTAITGLKMMEFPFALSLTAGQYWLAYGMSSASASQYTAPGTQLFNRFSNYGMSQPNLQFGTIGDATANSVGPFFGIGSFTTAGGGTTANFPISAVTTSVAHNMMMFQAARIA